MKSMIFATPGLRGLCGFDKVTQRAGRGCSSACAPFGFQREQIIFEGLQELIGIRKIDGPFAGTGWRG